MVKDIVPGFASSSPAHLTNVNGTLYFSADDGTHGQEIWKSDGTETGTIMLRDINPGMPGSYPEYFTDLNGKTFFTASSEDAGRELWESNGSASGTVMFMDVKVGTGSSAIAHLVVMGENLFFTADDGTGSYALWKSTGTIAGTTKVIDVSSGESDFFFLKAVNDNLYFLAYQNGEDYLWRSDGRQDGTRQVMLMSRATHPTFVMFKNSIYFFEYYWDPDIYSAFIKLNKMNPDGTDVEMIWKMNYGWSLEGRKLFQSPLLNINENLIFYGVLKNGQGFKILKSDGTSEGMSSVRDTYIPTFSGNPDLFTRAGGLLYLRSMGDYTFQDVFQTDGTPAGTFRLKRFDHIIDIEAMNETAYIAGVTFSGKWQLFKTDGTATGTTLIKQLPRGSSLVQANNLLYFFDSNNVLWKSDGTPAGTLRIKQFIRINGLFASGDQCYLFVTTSDGNQELWKTDGTTGGTVQVKRVGINLAYFETPITENNIFYFVGNDGVHGSELWRSDGTTKGTYMVKDLRTNDLNVHDFYSLTGFKGEVYFSAIESGTQYALFRSDGTSAGTRKITNMQAIVHYTSYKDQLLLFPVQSEPPTLWSTDGTLEGTRPVKTLEGATSFYEILDVTADNVVYFTTGSNCCGEEEFEGELWRTDGTECGTFEAETGLKRVSPVEVLGNRLILGGYKSYQYGKELYSYDLSNAPPNPCEAPYFYSTPNNGTVVLTAYNTTGFEISGDIIREGPNAGEIITEFTVPTGDTYVYVDDDALPGTTYLYVFEYKNPHQSEWKINLDYITPVATMPALGSFNLVSPAPYNNVYDVLRNGKVINIEGTNIQAEANDDYTGSVVFSLNGERHDDNTCPFSLFGDVDGNYNEGSLANGAYTLTAIAYPDENGQGTPGDTATVSFTVENIYSTEVSVYPNPIQSNSMVNIRGAANSPIHIDLMDHSGTGRRYILYEGVTDDTGRLNYPVSSRSLQPGIYILSVEVDGDVAQIRVVVE
jgi:ELWxxDGT repeat protein